MTETISSANLMKHKCVMHCQQSDTLQGLHLCNVANPSLMLDQFLTYASFDNNVNK